MGKNLIIAGNDKKDPVNTIRGTKTPLALLGTVKGVCDFLREYVGVRFLFVAQKRHVGHASERRERSKRRRSLQGRYEECCLPSDGEDRGTGGTRR